jgi:predicted nucleic acid-binding protein
MTRPVVCDAGPLIHLDQLGSLDLLSDFEPLLVPEEVWTEVLRHRPQALPRPFALAPVRVGTADADSRALTRAFSLDAGETACLALLADRKGALFLTDDAAARLVAGQLGIETHGTLGLLIRGVRKGTRTPKQILQVLEDLPARCTLHVSQKLRTEIIGKLREEWRIPPS